MPWCLRLELCSEVSGTDLDTILHILTPRAPPLPFLVPLAIPSLAPTRQVPSEYAVSVLSAHARCWTRQLQTAWSSKVRKVHPAEPPALVGGAVYR